MSEYEMLVIGMLFILTIASTVGAYLNGNDFVLTITLQIIHIGLGICIGIII